MTDDDVARRRASKRFNERVKLLATFLNNTGITILVGAAVLPLFAHPETMGGKHAYSVGVALLLHLVAQWVLAAYRSED